MVEHRKHSIVKIVEVDELDKKAQEQLHRLPAYGCEHMAYTEEAEAQAVIAMSQGMCGYKNSGMIGFNGPWKEIDEPIQLKIYTTPKEFFLDG